jgi:hypothetical protein
MDDFLMDNGDEDGKPQLWNIEYLWFIDFFKNNIFWIDIEHRYV